MQTIKVNIERNDDQNYFLIDGNVVAYVSIDPFSVGRYMGSFGVYGSCNNSPLPEALEFIGGCIKKHFAEFNLSVEFE